MAPPRTQFDYFAARGPRLTFEEAANSCNRCHSHLESIRQLAQAINPRGMSPTPREGSQPIYREDGTIDFYYREGFYFPDEFQRPWWSSWGPHPTYWSSSFYSFENRRMNYYFDGFNGAIATAVVEYGGSLEDNHPRCTRK